GVVPAFIGLGGMLYLILSASMGFWMLLEAFATLRERDEVREPAAKRLFGVSLLYVFVPFTALIVERLLHLPPLWT
ncbi:MAG: protoheme IX farnesyltransferase, partial [Proteobacteria bacterium]|nr:protoheme IX farnesyltransferase [Pseudomonadota bacterium]